MEKIEFPLLQPQDIEVKPKKITKTGALLLLYKTARTDAKILDDVLGPLNWSNENVVLDGVLYCKIGIRLKETDSFVWKMDCGVESAQEDGQEKKAESSDSFKRACSRLGIGRELYTSPQIWAEVATVQDSRGNWALKDRDAKYVVTNIEYDKPSRTIIALTICNAKTGVCVFDWTLPQNEAMKKKMNKITANQTAEASQSSASVAEVSANNTTADSAVSILNELVLKNGIDPEEFTLTELKFNIGLMAKKSKEKTHSMDVYNQIVEQNSGRADFKCKNATQADREILLGIYKDLVKGGYNG